MNTVAAMDLEDVVGIIAAFAIVIVVGVHALLKPKEPSTDKRQAAMKALAGRLGLGFSRQHDRIYDPLFRHFACFDQGQDHHPINTVRGPRAAGSINYELIMGDYKYEIVTKEGMRESRTVEHFSYLMAHLPWPQMPEVSICRERVVNRLGQAVGLNDIDFESDEFSRKFLVKGSDRRFVYDLINPEMMEFLMESDSPPVLIYRGLLVLSGGSERWSPEKFVELVSWVESFLRLWPRHVVDALGAGSCAS